MHHIVIAAAVLSVLCQLATAETFTFGDGENQFELEFVRIGAPGNPPDTDTRFLYPSDNLGSVDYAYLIGKYEISCGQMAAAAKSGAGNAVYCGTSEELPAYSPFEEAMQFVNWLNISSGYPPAYDPSDLFNWPPARNPDARYFIPNADEWYKAAYYAPVAMTYYRYATGSDVFPIRVSGGTEPNTVVIGPPLAEVTNAGGLSPFGTMAQNGNQSEWDENPGYNFLDGGEPAGSIRQDNRSSLAGLRVMAVPEPSSTFCLLLFGFLLVTMARSRRQLLRTAPAAILALSPLAAIAQTFTFGDGENQFEMEFVHIGSPGNPPDPEPAWDGSYGAVSYEYQIGKYEVSCQQVVAAALGGASFPVSNCPIGQTKPIHMMQDQAREFVNWLNTSSGYPPAYDVLNDPLSPRNPGARFFMPTTDEWYKAAYYDPVNDVYYDYATGSDEPPIAVLRN